MRNRGKRSFFTGSALVSRGARLTVRNASDPQRVGPHTFSLVRSGLVPRTRRQLRVCSLCSSISRAHRYQPRTRNIRRPRVEVGPSGWGQSFGRTGDSWYVERRGRRHTRRVLAPVGTRLTYFCGVHPRMWGTIRVVE
jgi:hypothetical protein